MQTGMRIFSGLTLFLLCASIHGEEVTSFEDAPTMVLVQEGSEPVTHKTNGVKASKALPKAVHAGEHKASDNSLYEMQSQLFSQNLDEDLREFNILPKGKSLYQKQTELYNKMLSRHTSEVTVLTQLKDEAFNSVLDTPKNVPGKLHDMATYDYLTKKTVPNFVFGGDILMQQEASSGKKKKEQPQGDPAFTGDDPDPDFDGPNNGHVPTGQGADCDPDFPNCQDLVQKSENPDGDTAFKKTDPAFGKKGGDFVFKKGAQKVLGEKKDKKDKKKDEKDKKDKKKDGKKDEKKDEKVIAVATTSSPHAKKTAEVDFVETNMFNF